MSIASLMWMASDANKLFLTSRDQMVARPPLPKAEPLASALPQSSLYALSALSIAAGFGALVFPFRASVAVEQISGVFLMAVGAFQLVVAGRMKRWAGTVALVTTAMLTIAAGSAMLLYPVTGERALTIFLGGIFLVGGVVRSVLAICLRRCWGWSLVMAHGFVGLVLGVFVLLSAPSIAFWFLGCDFLAQGVWLAVIRLQDCPDEVRVHDAGR